MYSMSKINWCFPEQVSYNCSDFLTLISGVCDCPAGFMLFEDSCVACAGPGSILDLNGVCQCANFATLVENSTDETAICQCDENYLPFNDICIICLGVGAFVNKAGQCSCGTGAMPDFINNLVQCVCPDNWVQSGDTCVQCDRGKISFLSFIFHVSRFTG